MRKNSIAIALGLCAMLLLTTAAPAQRSKKRTVKRVTHAVAYSGAETSLAGIKLMDSGTRLVVVYGSPDSIEPVGLGGGMAGPGGGAAGGAGGRALPGTGGATGPGVVRSGGGGGSAQTAQQHLPGIPNDFDFGNELFQGPGVPGDEGGPRKGGGPARAGGLAGGGGGAPGGGGGGPMMPGGGGGNMGMGSGGDLLYTRWVYNRSGAKYGFILDKYNRVVQCEAIGLQAGKARTRRGVTFGSSFATIVRRYGAPDGYEISSDNNLIVRYLNKAKCAFRLSRLGENKPHVVTGIVVAAGKR